MSPLRRFVAWWDAMVAEFDARYDTRHPEEKAAERIETFALEVKGGES